MNLMLARVGLGALGMIHHLTLQAVHAFEVSQSVYLDLPFETLTQDFDAVMGAGYSVSAFTIVA